RRPAGPRRPAARRGGLRALASRPAGRGREGGDPDAGRRGLTQRRVGRGGRVLGAVPRRGGRAPVIRRPSVVHLVRTGCAGAAWSDASVTAGSPAPLFAPRRAATPPVGT